MKYKFSIITILVVVSCMTDKKEITSDFKLKVLDQVLSDTTNLKILSSKSKLISNYPLLPPPSLKYYDSITNSYKESKSVEDFISKALNMENQSFIKQQMIANKNFDLSLLANYGYNMLDVKEYKANKISQDSLNKIVRKYNKKKNIKENDDYLIVSSPVFNEEMDKFYLRIASGSEGSSIVLSKVNNRWKLIRKVNYWVE